MKSLRDCPPNLTIPTQNALALSSYYVVPVSPDYLSSIGIALLVTRVKRFCLELEHNLEHAGIVISRVGRRSGYRERTKGSLRGEFGDAVFENDLTERSAVSESAEQQKSVFQMDKSDCDAIRRVHIGSDRTVEKDEHKVWNAFSRT